MSLSPQDWKRFDVLSGQLKVSDAAGDGELVLNAEVGTWVAMCEYDDDNRISMLAAMPERVADMMDGGVVEADGCEERKDFSAGSGIVCISDRMADGKLPSGFKVPDYKLNPAIVERYGKPDDDGKSEYDRFIESCYHMSCDPRTDMPLLEEVGYGAVCDMRCTPLDVGVLYNRMRDVIGLEITRREEGR